VFFYSFLCTWYFTQLCCSKFRSFQKRIWFRLRNFSGINWFNTNFMDINRCSIICICFLQSYISCQNCHMTAKSFWIDLIFDEFNIRLFGITRVCFNRDICLAHKHYMCLSVSFQYQCCIYMSWMLLIINFEMSISLFDGRIWRIPAISNFRILRINT